jgi:hypothetical protein
MTRMIPGICYGVKTSLKPDDHSGWKFPQLESIEIKKAPHVRIPGLQNLETVIELKTVYNIGLYPATKLIRCLNKKIGSSALFQYPCTCKTGNSSSYYDCIIFH